MKEIHKPVLVHSCRVKTDHIPPASLEREERYVEIRKVRKIKEFVAPAKLGEEIRVEEREIEESLTYLKMPKTCRCRNYITYYEADEAVANGKAMRIFKLTAKGIVKDETRVWMPVVREKVPRVDLISRPDIERAYVGSERKSKFYRFDPRTKRFVRIQEPPIGFSKTEWIEMQVEEETFERRIRQQYAKYIEDIHEMYMGFRARLITPFKPDPFEGRSLFFFPDQRTGAR